MPSNIATVALRGQATCFYIFGGRVAVRCHRMTWRVSAAFRLSFVGRESTPLPYPLRDLFMSNPNGKASRWREGEEGACQTTTDVQHGRRLSGAWVYAAHARSSPRALTHTRRSLLPARAYVPVSGTLLLNAPSRFRHTTPKRRQPPAAHHPRSAALSATVTTTPASVSRCCIRRTTPVLETTTFVFSRWL